MSESPIEDLIDLHRAHGVAIIGGVEFDFRHPEIDDRWVPSHELGWSSEFLLFPWKGAPRWLFPWTSKFWPAELEKRAALRGRAFLRHLAAFGPDGWLCAGDKVFISSVRRVRIGNEFEVEPDSIVLHVRYSVERADGRLERLRGKSVYVHLDRDWSARSGRIGGEDIDEGLTLAAVERRIQAVMRPGDVDESGVATDTCEANAAMCWNALAMADHWSEPIDKWRERMLVQAGYFLAKAEAAAFMAPFAERGLATLKGGAKGGRKSGLARRRAAEARAPHALELARTIRTKNPGRAQIDLAADIQNGWKLDGEPPGMTWLLGFIRDAELRGDLPKRTRKG